MGERPAAAPRCAAIVGPYLSGKTSLLESILFAAGAIPRKGTAKEHNMVGDATPEARARSMSVEVNIAGCDYLGEHWTFLDCPGSVELAQETQHALMVADAAVVVCEPEPDKALTLAPLLKFLDDNMIPHFLFINKMDDAEYRVRELLAALQHVSQRPLVLRQVPIRGDSDGGVTGYVDLVSERAYRYKPGQPSDLIQMPEDAKQRETEARREMLEALADFDDALLEQLLEDAVPSTDAIYVQLTKDLSDDLIVPVLLGAGEKDHGVRRLLKALRHEVPGPDVAAARIGLKTDAKDPAALVFKTYHLPHTGKLSAARLWTGEIKDGMSLSGHRLGSINRMMGLEPHKTGNAKAGEVVAFGRMDDIHTGQLLSGSGKATMAAKWPAPMPPLFSFAIEPENRQDEVKLTGAIARLREEDPSLSLEQNQDMHQMVLWGQGEIHLQIALERLKSKYNVPVKAHRPQVGYRETIRKGLVQHSRFKRQTGGHGQFGDVHIEVKPQPRGSGFQFQDAIVGGAIPRNFIPAVEDGVGDYLKRGPLGFPVVDVHVRLFDGQFHAVDSSEMAFKTAGRMAMTEAMPKCDPVLLEPICQVSVSVPNEYTAKVNSLVSGRRGQILGFDSKEGWTGWDEVRAFMPQSELHDLIIDLRSLTMGVGSFRWQFDHLQELTGRVADKIVQERQVAAQHA
ncbi:MAG: elongation factor G [Dongiaceae bacterium]